MSNVPNYNEQGGSRQVVGGSLDVVSGGEIDIESGGSLKLAGTAITPTAGEVNRLAGALAGATIVVTNASPSTVAIQLEDQAGADIDYRAAVDWYLSDDANGDTVTASAPSTGVTLGTDGVLIENVANVAGKVISEADGDIDIVVTHGAGSVTWYLVLVMPDGTLVVSDAITPE